MMHSQAELTKVLEYQVVNCHVTAAELASGMTPDHRDSTPGLDAAEQVRLAWPNSMDRVPRPSLSLRGVADQ